MAYYLDQLENDLLACLCAMLNAEGRQVCACHHYAGDDRPPADRCGIDGDRNGMAWLRRGETTLSTRDEGRAVWSGGFCGGQEAWITLIEIGIRRCIKGVQQDKKPVPTDLYNQDRELLIADRHTLLRVLCCDALTGQSDYNFGIESVNVATLGPRGACAGTILTLAVMGDPQANDEDQMQATVRGLAADPTGYTAQVAWTTPPVYVSGPAGVE